MLFRGKHEPLVILLLIRISFETGPRAGRGQWIGDRGSSLHSGDNIKLLLRESKSPVNYSTAIRECERALTVDGACSGGYGY